METNAKEKRLILIIRSITVFYMLALFFWGVTAFPLESEIRVACSIIGISLDVPPENYEGFLNWIATVAEGLINTNRDYPFLAYGTDWLAFSHLVIAVAFIGLYLDCLFCGNSLSWSSSACTNLWRGEGYSFLVAVNRLFVLPVWAYTSLFST